MLPEAELAEFSLRSGTAGFLTSCRKECTRTNLSESKSKFYFGREKEARTLVPGDRIRGESG